MYPIYHQLSNKYFIIFLLCNFSEHFKIHFIYLKTIYLFVFLCTSLSFVWRTGLDKNTSQGRSMVLEEIKESNMKMHRNGKTEIIRQYWEGISGITQTLTSLCSFFHSLYTQCKLEANITKDFSHVKQKVNSNSQLWNIQSLAFCCIGSKVPQVMYSKSLS